MKEKDLLDIEKVAKNVLTETQFEQLDGIELVNKLPEQTRALIVSNVIQLLATAAYQVFGYLSGVVKSTKELLGGKQWVN